MRAKRSFISGHAMPVAGTSFSDSPVPMPRITRPGNMAPNVPNACATIEGCVAKRGCQHAGAHDDALRACAQRAEPCQRERRMSARMPPGLEVIADEHRVEAQLFRQAGIVQQLVRVRTARPRPCIRVSAPMSFSVVELQSTLSQQLFSASTSSAAAQPQACKSTNRGKRSVAGGTRRATVTTPADDERLALAAAPDPGSRVSRGKARRA